MKKIVSCFATCLMLVTGSAWAGYGDPPFEVIFVDKPRSIRVTMTAVPEALHYSEEIARKEIGKVRNEGRWELKEYGFEKSFLKDFGDDVHGGSLPRTEWHVVAVLWDGRVSLRSQDTHHDNAKIIGNWSSRGKKGSATKIK